MDMNLSKLQEIVEDRRVWCAEARGVAKSQIQLSDWTTTTTTMNTLVQGAHVLQHHRTSGSWLAIMWFFQNDFWSLAFVFKGSNPLHWKDWKEHEIWSLWWKSPSVTPDSLFPRFLASPHSYVCPCDFIFANAVWLGIMTILLKLDYMTSPVCSSVFFLVHDDEDLKGYSRSTREKKFRSLMTI